MLEQEKVIIECNFGECGLPLQMADKNLATNVSEDEEVSTKCKDISRNQDETKDSSNEISKEKVKSEAASGAEIDLDVENGKAKYKRSETNIDTGKEACPDCERLEKENRQFQKENSQLLNDALNESENINKELTKLKVLNEKLEEKVKQLTVEKNNATERYVQIKQRSDEITARMAEVFDAKVELENVNDEFSNTKLAKRFERLYTNNWASLTELLFYNIDGLDEVDMIKNMTSLMKKALETCTNISERETRVFLALEDDEPIPTSREDPLLYKVNRKYGKTEKKRNTIKKCVWEILTKEDWINEILTEEHNEITEEGKAKFEEFFNEFIDICWLTTLSQPKLKMNFHVVGELYEGSIRDRFTQYACQDTVKDTTKVKNTIVEVVWPSIELADGSGIHTKGDVIVVEEGFNEKETSEIESDVKERNGENSQIEDETSEIESGVKERNRESSHSEDETSENGPREEDKNRADTSEKSKEIGTTVNEEGCGERTSKERTNEEDKTE